MEAAEDFHAPRPCVVLAAPPTHHHHSHANRHSLSLSLPLHIPTSSTPSLPHNLLPQQQQQQQRHYHQPHGHSPLSSQHVAQVLPLQPLFKAPPLAPEGKNVNRNRLPPPRDDCWSQDATLALIKSWGDRYAQLNRGNLKQQHWKDVADAVNARLHGSKAPKTDVQCKNRLDTLKKKYKMEKTKIAGGWGPSKWLFFEKLDELIGPSKKQNESPPAIKVKHVVDDNPEQKLIVYASNFAAVDTNSKSKHTPVMTDSCSYGFNTEADGNSLKRARPHDNPYRDLAQAIVKFGEVYERIESAKQQQMMDLEKERMAFTRDVELQKMRLFMQTQLEVAKMKHRKCGNTA